MFEDATNLPTKGLIKIVLIGQIGLKLWHGVGPSMLYKQIMTRPGHKAPSVSQLEITNNGSLDKFKQTSPFE